MGGANDSLVALVARRFAACRGCCCPRSLHATFDMMHTCPIKTVDYGVAPHSRPSARRGKTTPRVSVCQRHEGTAIWLVSASEIHRHQDERRMTSVQRRCALQFGVHQKVAQSCEGATRGRMQDAVQDMDSVPGSAARWNSGWLRYRILLRVLQRFLFAGTCVQRHRLRRCCSIRPILTRGIDWMIHSALFLYYPTSSLRLRALQRYMLGNILPQPPLPPVPITLRP